MRIPRFGRSLWMGFILVVLVSPSVGLAGPIHEAARDGDIEKVKNLLLAGTNINEKDEAGQTPLHVAVNWDSANVVKFLLEKGADPNTQNKHGSTPLIRVIIDSQNLINEEFSLKMLKMLLAHGGNPNLPGKENQTPLHFSALHGNATVARLLVSHGGNVDKKDIKEFTPLHYAINKGNAPVAKVLIESGANVNERYDNEETLIDRATEEGLREIVTLLNERGAKRTKAGPGKNRLPRILVRFFNEKEDSYSGSELFRFLRRKQNDIVKEGTPLASSLSLEHSCNLSVKEDSKITDKSRDGEITYIFERLNRDPSMFDFAITYSMFSEEGPEYFSPSPLIIDVRENWEIYKTSIPSLKHNWEITYTLMTTNFKDVPVEFVTEQLREALAAQLLEETVAFKRGPILKEICDFIEQHYKPESSFRSP